MVSSAASPLVKKAVGTYIEDSKPSDAVLCWIQAECRSGSLAETVSKFSKAQAEELDPGLVLVENVAANSIVCRIPCCCYDHESVRPFESEVRFTLDPTTQTTSRLG